MLIADQLKNDLKEAMRAKDEECLSTLRMLSSAITNKAIEFRKKDTGLSDEEILGVIRSEVKKRKDAIEEYTKGGRLDLAGKEERETHILLTYLPPEISDDEIARIVEDGIRELGAAGPADFGKVMKSIMPILKGKASGDRVSKLLKEKLEE